MSERMAMILRTESTRLTLARGSKHATMSAAPCATAAYSAVVPSYIPNIVHKSKNAIYAIASTHGVDTVDIVDVLNEEADDVQMTLGARCFQRGFVLLIQRRSALRVKCIRHIRAWTARGARPPSTAREQGQGCRPLQQSQPLNSRAIRSFLTIKTMHEPPTAATALTLQRGARYVTRSSQPRRVASMSAVLPFYRCRVTRCRVMRY